jgi:hypothetical protein
MEAFEITGLGAFLAAGSELGPAATGTCDSDISHEFTGLFELMRFLIKRGFL